MSTRGVDSRVAASPAEAASAAPRLRRTRWTPERIWRRWRLWVITIVNLTVFFLFWQFFANRAHNRDAPPSDSFWLLLPVAMVLLIPAGAAAYWAYKHWRRSVRVKASLERADSPSLRNAAPTS